MSPKRIAQILTGISVWFFFAALWSLFIVRILSAAASPLLLSLTDFENAINRFEDINALKRICIEVIKRPTDVNNSFLNLTNWSLGLMLVWSALFCIFSLLLYRKLNSPGALENNYKESLFDAAVTGKIKLWKAFWGFYIAFPYIVALLGFPIFAMYKWFSINPLSPIIVIPASLAISAITIAHYWGAFVAWRCSKNSQKKFWCYGARIAVILYTGTLCVGTIIGLVFFFSKLP